MSTTAKCTIADWKRMIARGEFDPPNDRRVELIRGEIREMSPIGPPHGDIVSFLIPWSLHALRRANFKLRVQDVLAMVATDSVPQPDIAWVSAKAYWDHWPTSHDTHLVIEVADSSARYDLGEKAALYAAAGVPEYWVVDIAARMVVVHRRPEAGGYGDIRHCGIGETIAPLCDPEAALAVADLFPR